MQGSVSYDPSAIALLQVFTSAAGAAVLDTDWTTPTQLIGQANPHNLLLEQYEWAQPGIWVPARGGSGLYSNVSSWNF